jgi:hypothetical protein
VWVLCLGRRSELLRLSQARHGSLHPDEVGVGGVGDGPLDACVDAQRLSTRKEKGSDKEIEVFDCRTVLSDSSAQIITREKFELTVL